MGLQSDLVDKNRIYFHLGARIVQLYDPPGTWMDVDTNVEMRIHCDLLLSREAPRILSSRINV